MPMTTREAFRERLGARATHTNHPVTLISPHAYYETRQGAILPFKRFLGCVTLTCDPLPGVGTPLEALAEFDEAYARKTAIFLGITEPVASALAELGYSVLKIGEEPWVDLANWEPRGNRGKGIRAARNQALGAGCQAREVDGDAFRALRPEVEEVFREWQGLTLISLEGGVLGAAPFADIPGRRFFLGVHQGRLEAVLVATAVRPGHSYYLEDLVYRRKAPRGIQELLTLTALEALGRDGASRASLGMVLLRRLEQGGVSTYNPRSLTVRFLRKCISFSYNAEGQDLFRKRFPVAAWENAYVAFRSPRPGPRLAPWLPRTLGLAWALVAVLAGLDPVLQLPF